MNVASTPPAFVWLASQSPRRAQLLAQLGVAHRVLSPDPGEDTEALEALRPGELPEAYVQRVTAAKLAAALQRLQRRAEAEGAGVAGAAPLLAADTTVALGDAVLGKPDDAAHAAHMLRALSGRAHRVLTAVAVYDRRRGTVQAALDTSRVVFAALDDATIAAYVAGGEPFGKAGAYAVQGAIAGWIERIEGSHSGIMGLPLFETRRLLQDAGLRVPAPATR